ncbi:hypothetical protein KUA55_17365, partial [Enterococcus sp. ALS3]
MKKRYLFSLLLLAIMLFLFPKISNAEVMTSTWGTAPISFDTDTQTMTVDSGELSNSGYPVDIFNQTKKIV